MKNKTNEIFSVAVARALDTLSNGKGFGNSERKIIRLCDAAPKLLKALKIAHQHLMDDDAKLEVCKTVFEAITNAEGLL